MNLTSVSEKVRLLNKFEVFAKLFTVITISLFFILGSKHLNAHSKSELDLQLILSLDKQAFSAKLWLPAFAIPDLASIKPDDAFPKMEDKKKALEAYLSKTCPVKIDGITVNPILNNLLFETVEDYDENEDLSKEWSKNEGDFQKSIKKSVTSLVMTELQWSYPIKALPDQISIQWGIYLSEETDKESNNSNPDSEKTTLPTPMDVSALFKEYGKIKLITFSISEPEHTWHRAAKSQQNLNKPVPKRKEKKLSINLLIPLLILWAVILFISFRNKKSRWKLALVLFIFSALGTLLFRNKATIEIQPFWDKTPTLTEEEAIKIFIALHSNIYRAFDYEDEDDIYDVLEQSVDGELLDDLYEDIYQSLILRDEGGAVCKINNVSIKQYTFLPNKKANTNSSFQMECSWEVEGIVHHWEHIHRRVNAYKAIYTLIPKESSWKIASIDVSEHKRLGEKQNKGDNNE